jgi:DNA-directed RNA polymerase subunit RPC12/RpoP
MLVYSLLLPKKAQPHVPDVDDQRSTRSADVPSPAARPRCPHCESGNLLEVDPGPPEIVYLCIECGRYGSGPETEVTP